VPIGRRTVKAPVTAICRDRSRGGAGRGSPFLASFEAKKHVQDAGTAIGEPLQSQLLTFCDKGFSSYWLTGLNHSQKMLPYPFDIIPGK